MNFLGAILVFVVLFIIGPIFLISAGKGIGKGIRDGWRKGRDQRRRRPWWLR